MTKVRFIHERLDANGVPEQHEFETGKVKHNQGNGYNYVDSKGVLRCHLPGDVFEVEEAEADRLVKRYPHMFIMETAWQSLMARLNRVKPDREAKRQEHRLMLEKRAEEQLAADRLQRTIAEHQDNLRKANVLATQQESLRQTAELERDATNAKLERLLAAMEQQQQANQQAQQRIAELEARLSTQVTDAKPEGRRGRRAQAEQTEHTESSEG